ncbi:MAG: sulfate transporter family protein [Rhizobiaceae bacterium]|nr:sulfate transporter family protein [Rhizobiaceae bacterium]
MILTAVRAAFADVLDPRMRAVFFKTVGLTLLALIAFWFGISGLFEWLAMPWFEGLFAGLPDWTGWVGTVAAVIAGIALALGLALLVAPASAIVAGLFLDEAADIVETNGYPDDAPGTAVPTFRALVLSLKFFGVVIVGNLVALLLLLVPGVNIAAFFLVNGYLLGREFFEFAAMRFRSETEAKAMRRAHAGTIFLAGLVIAAVLAVPVINLATPLFAAALMVHLHKMLSSGRVRPGTAPALRQAA